MALQIRIQELAAKHAPDINSTHRLAVAMGLSSDDWDYVQQLWTGNAKQLSLARLKEIVRALKLDPGNVTLAEFFTFDGVRRKKSFVPSVATINQKAPLHLRARQLSASYNGKALFTCFGCWNGYGWLSEKGEAIPNVKRWRANPSSPWVEAGSKPVVLRRVQIEARAIMTAYALQSACQFSNLNVAIGLWKGTPKKVGLANLENLVRGLSLDPAATSLAELFDFNAAAIKKPRQKREAIL